MTRAELFGKLDDDIYEFALLPADQKIPVVAAQPNLCMKLVMGSSNLITIARQYAAY